MNLLRTNQNYVSGRKPSYSLRGGNAHIGSPRWKKGSGSEIGWERKKNRPHDDDQGDNRKEQRRVMRGKFSEKVRLGGVKEPIMQGTGTGDPPRRQDQNIGKSLPICVVLRGLQGGREALVE